ncbi:MAG TPA: efflux RND transporter periplasmic adaptor subunit [Chthoniobacter sp.]|jgi:RND family efflux transporter MFP subunit
MITDEPMTLPRERLRIPVKADSKAPVSLPLPSRRSNWSTWLAAGIAVFGVAVFSGIRARQQAESHLQEVADTNAIPSVNVTFPKAGGGAAEITLPGNTQAYSDTPIYAHTNGYLKKWYVDIGARVRAGDLLAEIEVPELDQQLHQAEADLQTAQANLELAKVTNARWQELVSRKVISLQEADQVKSDLGVKQALYVANEANVHRLQEVQKYERIVAPFDGIITARGTDIGALVDSGSGGSAHELFHLAALQTLRVYISVPEIYADSLQDGSTVTITQSANAVRTFTGTIVRNSSAIDQTTRTLNVEVDVDNGEGHLLPGAYVIVHLKLPGKVSSVTIPSNALLFRGEGLRVARVIDGKVSLAAITIGNDFGSTVEVTSGLSAKDLIILDPSDSLADGAHVAINEPTKTAGTK